MTIIKLLSWLQSVDFKTKKGLQFYSIGVLALAIVILSGLKNLILLPPIFYYSALIGAQLVTIVLWLASRIYFGDPSILTIALAVRPDSGASEIYRQVIQQFKDDLVTFELWREVKFKELPHDTSFEDEKAAEIYINKQGIRVLIWGTAKTGTMNGSEMALFNLRTSYLFSARDDASKSGFTNDLDSALRRAHWDVPKTQTIVGVQIVEGNILEMSLYTMALSLLSSQAASYALLAVKILEILHIRLKERNQDSNFPNLDDIKKRTRDHLVRAHTNLCSQYLEQRVISDAINHGQRALQLDDSAFIACINLALAFWLRGEKTKSHEYTKKARKLKPNSCLPTLNMAFYAISEGKYDKAIREYRKVANVSETRILDVVSFIENELNVSPLNSGYLFASGLLNYYFGDIEKGLRQLTDVSTLIDQKSRPLQEEAMKVLST